MLLLGKTGTLGGKKKWMNPATKHPENTGHMVSLSNDIRSERTGCDETGWNPRACEEEEEGGRGGGGEVG